MTLELISLFTQLKIAFPDFEQRTWLSSVPDFDSSLSTHIFRGLLYWVIKYHLSLLLLTNRRGNGKIKEARILLIGLLHLGLFHNRIWIVLEMLKWNNVRSHNMRLHEMDWLPLIMEPHRIMLFGSIRTGFTITKSSWITL